MLDLPCAYRNSRSSSIAKEHKNKLFAITAFPWDWTHQGVPIPHKHTHTHCTPHTHTPSRNEVGVYSPKRPQKGGYLCERLASPALESATREKGIKIPEMWDVGPAVFIHTLPVKFPEALKQR